MRECNDKGAPLDEFQAGFCARCINPECSRSLYGQSRFDLRVNTWHERLFSQVPTMDAHDPRYAGIAGQKFLTFDTGRMPEIRGDWLDPRDLSAQTPPTPAPMLPATPTPPPSPPAPPEAPKPSASPGRVPVRLLQANTPFVPGQMVGQPPVQPEGVPAKDPWAAPEPPKDPIVPVGSRVKMKGSGV